MDFRLYVTSIIFAVLAAAPAAIVPSPTATPIPAATVPSPTATPIPAATVPNPLQVDLGGRWWDSTLLGSLLGVAVGAALTAGAEELRRRSDQSKAQGAGSAAARMARFADDLADARRAAESTARAAATVGVLVEIAQVSTVPPQTAKALTLSSAGITDQRLATDVDLLAARLAAFGGSDASAPPGGTLHDKLVELARQVEPQLAAERSARRAAADALATTGRQEAEQEAAALRKT
jgi:hypothetical protein